MNEWTYVISTINTVLGVDILDRSRHRALVDARSIFYHIMRYDFKKTVHSIGKHTYKNHSTVLHSLNTFENLIKTDKEFREKYNRVAAVISGAEEVGTLMTEEDIKQIQEENSFLLSSNELLTLQLDNRSKEIKQLEREMLKFSFYSELFDRIIHMAPQGKEEELSKKLNTFLNGVRL